MKRPSNMCYTKSLSIFMTYSVAKCVVIDIVYWQRDNVKMTNENIRCLATLTM